MPFSGSFLQDRNDFIHGQPNPLHIRPTEVKRSFLFASYHSFRTEDQYLFAARWGVTAGRTKETAGRSSRAHAISRAAGISSQHILTVTREFTPKWTEHDGVFPVILIGQSRQNAA